MYAENDIIRLIVHSDLAGVDMVNVYHFESDHAGALDATLGETIRNNFLDPIAECQSAQVNYRRVELLNLTDGISYYEHVFPTPLSGARPGEFLPTFVSWAFRLNRQTRQTRNGQKRLSGVAEGDIDGNNPVGVVLPLLTQAASSMGSPLPVGLDESLVPVIVRFDAVTQTVTAVNPVVNATFTRVSSQNTRKVY